MKERVGVNAFRTIMAYRIGNKPNLTNTHLSLSRVNQLPAACLAFNHFLDTVQRAL